MDLVNFADLSFLANLKIRVKISKTSNILVRLELQNCFHSYMPVLTQSTFFMFRVGWIYWSLQTKIIGIHIRVSYVCICHYNSINSKGNIWCQHLALSKSWLSATPFGQPIFRQPIIWVTHLPGNPSSRQTIIWSTHVPKTHCLGNPSSCQPIFWATHLPGNPSSIQPIFQATHLPGNPSSWQPIFRATHLLYNQSSWQPIFRATHLLYNQSSRQPILPATHPANPAIP